MKIPDGMEKYINDYKIQVCRNNFITFPILQAF